MGSTMYAGLGHGHFFVYFTPPVFCQYLFSFISFLPSISRRSNKRWKGDRITEKGGGKSRELVRETKAEKKKKRQDKGCEQQLKQNKSSPVD